MKRLSTSVSVALAAFTVLVGLPPPAQAQPVPLGSASNFAVLAGSGITVAGAVNSSAITGDIGTFPTPSITGLGNVVLTGTNHAGDAVTQTAKNDLVTAYNTAAGRPVTTTVATELGATTKLAGVYDSASGTFGITGILTLDGNGDPNAVFIFKMATTLITAASSEVRLINGAQANNVYWQVGSSATLGSSSIFKGNLLALTAITMGTSATADGRLLARNSFTQLDGSNTIRVVFTAQTIAFAAIPAHLACDAPFTFVLPVATSGLPVTLAVSGPATVVGNTVTLTGATGTVVLTATQAGDASYSAAPSVVQSFTVGACSQTIAFAAIPNHLTTDAPFTFVFPVATSGLPVTLAVTSGPATVAGNTVTLTGAVGTVVLTATQPGNATYAAAPSVAQSFAVGAVALLPQTIAFAAIPAHFACDGPFTFVLPVATSGLPVTLAVSGPAIVAGNTVTLTGATGTVVLTATQAGNATYSAAASVAQSFAVGACPQTIAFAAIPNHLATDAPFTFVYPVATSGLPVALAVSGPATVAGNTVTLTGAVGTVLLTATQPGNATYAAAPSVAQSFAVSAVPLTAQTITFAAVPGRNFCDGTFTVSPTASSGLPVALAVTSGPATVVGNTVTVTGTGSITLQSTQAGNGTFASAAPVAQTFAVAACAQTIAFAPIAAHTACDAPFTFVFPLASSGLAVSLTVSGPATLAGGNVVTLTGAVGTVVLTATQAGNANFSAAPSVVQNIAVTACPPAAQVITFAPIPGHTACDPAFTFVFPVASSGLPVTLTVSGPATVAGNTVTLTGAVGTVVLTASQAGNAAFAPASNVAQSIVVAACIPAPTAQTIAFASIPGHTACDPAFTFALPVASSGLPVTLAVSGPATVVGNTVTLTGAVGTVVLTATQAGDATFAPAPLVVQSFAVAACAPAAQTIAFAPVPNHTACDVPFSFVFPVASSALPVTLAVSGPATVAGNTVTLTGAVGTVVLTATQAGNAAFAPAPNVVQSFVVAACPPSAQTITFGPIPNHTACDPAFTIALPVASSSLPVTLTVSGPATVAGNTVTLTGAVGTVVLTASQAGNATFAPASNVAQSIVVAACVTAALPQTITFAAIPNHTACDAPFTFGAPVASSGLPVTLVVSGPATVAGNTVTLTGVVGTVVLTATQAGNATYAPASSVTQSFAASDCCVAPIITNSPLTAAGTLGKPFSFAITASGSPTSYSAFNLPAGLALNALTGVISGTPTRDNTTTFVTLTATNGACSGTAILMIVVAPVDCIPPVITNNPLTASGRVGTPFTFTITASGSPTKYTAFNLPPGLALNPVTGVISGTPTHEDVPPTLAALVVVNGTENSPRREATLGPTFVTITAANGDCYSAPVYLMIVIAPAPVPPVITSSTSLCPTTVGTPFNYQITATGSPTSYTAVGLPAGLALNSLTGAITGTPTRAGTSLVNLGAANSSGNGPGLLTIVVAPVSCLVNVSSRMNVTTGEGTLIVGLSIRGTGPKTVLVRGVGPTLATFGVTGVLADPAITVFAGNTPLASNDNWGTGTNTAAQITSASAQVGAFALVAGSKDAALLVTLPPGNYTVQLTGVGNVTGAALVEVYDTQ